MTQKWQREEKEVERLQRELRELKSENKSLRRRLRTLSKGYHKFLDEEDSNKQLKEIQKIAEKLCWECEGVYKLIILGNKRFRRCTVCNKTGKVTNISGD